MLNKMLKIFIYRELLKRFPRLKYYNNKQIGLFIKGNLFDSLQTQKIVETFLQRY